jgi:hypothetical protein
MSEEERSTNTLSEAFDRSAEALLAAGASYALIGGFAVAYHGLPRPTRDIDLLLSGRPRMSTFRALATVLWRSGMTASRRSTRTPRYWIAERWSFPNSRITLSSSKVNPRSLNFSRTPGRTFPRLASR